MRLRAFRAAAPALAVAITACREGAAPPDAGPLPGVSAAAPSSSAAASSSPAAASSSPVAAPSADAGAPRSAGTGEACTLRRGPLQLALKGPALLLGADPGAGGDPRVIFNRDGVSHRVAPVFPALADVGAPEGVAAEQRAAWPACASADPFVFCMDLSGAIRRAPLSGGAESPVGFGRRGTAIAAVALPGGHTLLAFLADRKTSEGVVTQAFLVVDDRPAVPLSAEGSGATFVGLSPWKGRALAMYVDARVALTPVHARTVGLADNGALELGPDAVIFVGDGADTRMSGAVAAARMGPAFVLIPTAKEASQFGMAAIRIDDAPRDDMPAVWSLYPNGLSPAPIAATRGASAIHVARVRPASGEPGALRVIEIGLLDAEGRFQPRCQAAESASFKHVALDLDRDGALWLAYTTASGTFLEQRALVAARP